MKNQSLIVDILEKCDPNPTICEQQPVYQLLFIQDKNQSIEAYETNCIKCAYEELINQLETGNSVFINQKRIQA